MALRRVTHRILKARVTDEVTNDVKHRALIDDVHALVRPLTRYQLLRGPLWTVWEFINVYQ